MDKITLETGFKITAKKVNSFQDILSCKRLFYELVVHYTGHTGFFKEIHDVPDFIKCEKLLQKKKILHNCSEKYYIDHHNFHIK